MAIGHLSNLTEQEAIESGSKIGALIGLVEIGLMPADEARELHAMETAAAARS